MFTAQRFMQDSLRQAFRSAEGVAGVLRHLEMLDEVLREAAERAITDARAWEDPTSNVGLFAFWTLEDPDLQDADALRMALAVLGPETVTERAVLRLRREVRVAAARWSPEMSGPLLEALAEVREPRIVEALHARFDLEDEIRAAAQEAAQRLLQGARTATHVDERIEGYAALSALAEVAPLPEEVRDALLSRLESLPSSDPGFLVLFREEDVFRYEPHDEARQILGLLLADREMPADRLRRLVPWAMHLHFGRGATRLAVHPGADAAVWLAMLKESPSLSIASTVGLSPRAWQEERVAERLARLPKQADQAGEGGTVRYYLSQGAPERLVRGWWPELLLADPALALALVVEVRPELAEHITDADCEQLLASPEVRQQLLLEAPEEESLVFEEDQDRSMASLALAPGASFAFRLIERWRGSSPPGKRRKGGAR